MRSVCMSVALVALAGALAPRVARADPTADDKARAEKLFEEGKALGKAEKWSEACPKYEESQLIDPAIGTQFKLADCYEHVGKTASAWANFLEAASAARRLKQAEREKIAGERAAALAQKLTKLSVEVAAPSTPGLEVHRDGRPVGRGLWGTPIPVDPGKHLLRATAPGRRAWEGSIDARGEGATVTASVPALPNEGAAAIESLAPTRENEKPSGTPPGPRNDLRRTVGVVLAGTGGATIAIGGVLGALAIVKNQTALGECAPMPTGGVRFCSQRGLDDTASARGLATGSTIAVIGGGLLTAGGLALFFTAPKKSGASALEVRAQPGGATLAGTF